MIVHKTLESHAPQCWTACTDMCLSPAVLSLSVQSVGNVLMTCVALHSKQKNRKMCCKNSAGQHVSHCKCLHGDLLDTFRKRFPQHPFHVSVCLEKNQKQAHQSTHDSMFWVSFPGQQTTCVEMTSDFRSQNVVCP